ncbi:Hypothetical predicted protein [Paramuricea clavata]|uniref:Uncharacterized protein n=1 Tax=Paramuricea clavata TaxID=317549 RepID=A0A6S7GIJ5_PARCT|nr:Hypothetical predicted protein [Paramuricea clavata]
MASCTKLNCRDCMIDKKLYNTAHSILHCKSTCDFNQDEKDDVEIIPDDDSETEANRPKKRRENVETESATQKQRKLKSSVGSPRKQRKLKSCAEKEKQGKLGSTSTKPNPKKAKNFKQTEFWTNSKDQETLDKLKETKQYAYYCFKKMEDSELKCCNQCIKKMIL